MGFEEQIGAYIGVRNKAEKPQEFRDGDPVWVRHADTWWHARVFKRQTAYHFARENQILYCVYDRPNEVEWFEHCASWNDGRAPEEGGRK